MIFCSDGYLVRLLVEQNLRFNISITNKSEWVQFGKHNEYYPLCLKLRPKMCQVAKFLATIWKLHIQLTFALRTPSQKSHFFDKNSILRFIHILIALVMNYSLTFVLPKRVHRSFPPRHRGVS